MNLLFRWAASSTNAADTFNVDGVLALFLCAWCFTQGRATTVDRLQSMRSGRSRETEGLVISQIEIPKLPSR